ncbi:MULTISPECIES: hypothetical protein [Pseudonocardiaceae]|uniref:Uncharacterized protein n=1 Tax=Saccharomonospora amisosensis TaxID=1128677 RepID=A0A7X5ZP74_9PSEU|nr:hypothetical protein [Saccharomonospora amisosensis]NIJ10508.1 hypothetical protein [Saccharomonospora amisosensis]
MLTYFIAIIGLCRARLDELRSDERGYSTEAVLVTALLVAAAIAVIAIIVAAVTRKAGEINDKM